MADIYATYIGDGAFVNGVPARDLTKAEWDELTAEQRKAAVDLKLYRVNAHTREEPLRETAKENKR